MGAVCYADDVLLIAPTRTAMQRMLYELEVFAAESNITFSTDPSPAKSKTKCIYVVGNKHHLAKPAPLLLGGHVLPFVAQADHLGNILTEQGSMEQDTAVKRARFIQSSVEIREQFKFAAPAEVVKALKVYSNSFYGCNLWDLGGDKAKQVYTAWNTAVKLAWGCPQWTRTYFLQQMLCCGHSSARVDILCRFVTFFHSLRLSACHEGQIMSRLVARDIQSVTGKNLHYILEETALNPWSSTRKRLKDALLAGEAAQVPQQDRWRLPYLSSLLSQRREAHNLAQEDVELRLSELIDSLVKN